MLSLPKIALMQMALPLVKCDLNAQMSYVGVQADLNLQNHLSICQSKELRRLAHIISPLNSSS